MDDLHRRAIDQMMPHGHGDPSWDFDIESLALRILPGEHRVSAAEDVALVTILGSCVAACIRDPVLRIGGMNHFLLPGADHRDDGQMASDRMRYGQFAMRRLIDDLLEAGAQRQRLEVKIFGGSTMFRSTLLIGETNVEFVHAFLGAQGVSIAAEDVGGPYARRICYFPTTGAVLRLLMRRDSDRTVFAREQTYLNAVGGIAEFGSSARLMS